jgi:hypothetical protein
MPGGLCRILLVLRSRKSFLAKGISRGSLSNCWNIALLLDLRFMLGGIDVQQGRGAAELWCTR